MKTMIKFTTFFSTGLFCGLLALAPAYADPLEDNLVARWTFKDGSLTSDIGNFLLNIEGRDLGEVISDNGTITIDGRENLTTSEINSVAFPELRETVTLWARLRFDTLPSEWETSFLSLQKEPKSGDWADMVLSLLYLAWEKKENVKGVSFLGRLEDGETEVGVGSGRLIPIPEGEFINVAIVFDGGTRQAGMWVNGRWEASVFRDFSQLDEFGAFGFGQLKIPGSDYVKITFDEVRVYSTVLQPEWLEEIQPIDD